MSYIRFGLMILTSTLVMFGLMYLNTYAFEHVFFSETRAYMAVLMGAAMALVMLGFMLGMYKNRNLNLAIFAGAIVVFALSLWLVRSQVTVTGSSYMSAMIPHHSIAIMTSERAGIEDARVRKLADEIIDAQNREISEMRYLIGDMDRDVTERSVYEDPAAVPGTVQDALDTTLISRLDPSPLASTDIDQILEGELGCSFRRTEYENPILRAGADNSNGVMKLNGVIIALEGEANGESALFSSDGVEMRVQSLEEEANWRENAELVFALEQGVSVGYRGFYDCP